MLQVAPALRSVSLEVLAAATPAGQEAARLRAQLVAAAAAASSARGSSSSSRRGGSSSSKRSSNSSSSGGQGLWEQMLALEAAAAAEVLGKAQVVAATCVGAGELRLCCSIVAT
jgi:fumarylacetoacetate (FAA) hydrolase family protein